MYVAHLLCMSFSSLSPMAAGAQAALALSDSSDARTPKPFRPSACVMYCLSASPSMREWIPTHLPTNKRFFQNPAPRACPPLRGRHGLNLRLRTTCHLAHGDRGKPSLYTPGPARNAIMAELPLGRQKLSQVRVRSDVANRSEQAQSVLGLAHCRHFHGLWAAGGLRTG